MIKKEICPKCKSDKLVVYFMNGISWANDYHCKKCSNNFRYSVSKNKYFKLPMSRVSVLDKLSVDK